MPTRRDQRIATGEGVDAAWFHEFYEDVLPVVYGYFFNRCGGRREFAADLTQETFASALVSLRNGATPESPRQWIITIARRRLIDHIRRRKPVEPMGDRDPEIWVGSGWATETEARLVEALDLLREDHRLALKATPTWSQPPPERGQPHRHSQRSTLAPTSGAASKTCPPRYRSEVQARTGNGCSSPGPTKDPTNDIFGEREPAAYEYVPGGGWTELPRVPIDGQSATVAWVEGTGLLAWNYGLESAMLDPSGSWRQTGDVPMPPAECNPRSFRTASGIAGICGGIALFDAETESWKQVPHPLDTRVVATDTALYGLFQADRTQTQLISYPISQNGS